jgi:hypothetical protein
VLVLAEVSVEDVELSLAVAFVSVFVSVVSVLTGGFFPA